MKQGLKTILPRRGKPVVWNCEFCEVNKESGLKMAKFRGCLKSRWQKFLFQLHPALCAAESKKNKFQPYFFAADPALLQKQKNLNLLHSFQKKSSGCAASAQVWIQRTRKSIFSCEKTTSQKFQSRQISWGIIHFQT